MSFQLAYQGKIYFSAYDPTHGQEPYVSDGTAEGTIPLADIASGLADSNPRSFTVGADKRVYFTAQDQTNDFQAWATEGTPATTSKVNLGNNIEFPYNYLAFNHKTYFVNHYNQLWRTDGTPGGTAQVFSVGRTDTNDSIQSLRVFRKRLMFVGNRQTASGFKSSIFTSDGTEAGTHSIATIGPKLSLIFYTATRNRLILVVSSANHRKNYVWQSDGTPQGTSEIFKVPGKNIVNVTPIAASSSKAYFVTDEPKTAAKPHVWQTDGTPSGTKVLATLPHFSDSHNIFPQYLNNRLFVSLSFDSIFGKPTPPSRLYLIKTT